MSKNTYLTLAIRILAIQHIKIKVTGSSTKLTGLQAQYVYFNYCHVVEKHCSPHGFLRTPHPPGQV